MRKRKQLQKPRWKLEIEFVPYESEKDRDRAYEQWVELFLKADARRLASLDRQNR